MDRNSVLSKSLSIPKTDFQKRATQSESLVIGGSFCEGKIRGKEMWQLNVNGKELEGKIQRLENRIQYLSFEQKRTERSIEDAKRKHEAFSRIRDEVAQERISKNQLKKENDREYLENKERLRKDKEQLESRIKEKKEKCIADKQKVKNFIKNKCMFDMTVREKQEFERWVGRREEAMRIKQAIKMSSKRRNSSFMDMLKTNEEEYYKKMKQEEMFQEKAVKKIDMLVKLEQEFMERLQNTQKMQETVTRICLP